MNNIINNDFKSISINIKQARQKVYAQINRSLIELYWDIGTIISRKVKQKKWGESVVSELAKFIIQNDPTSKGFSDKNLWRMKQFYETYKDDKKLSPLLRELSWTQNMIIFSRCKRKEEREFYLRMTIKEKYSSRELDRQIDTSLFDKQLSAIKNFHQ